MPYGDPWPAYFPRTAFDVGEYGIGMFANSLELGCDCLGEIYYFVAAGHDSRGQTITIPNAICMHAEDFGLLWMHVDWRIGYTESRRSRRLVVSFIATVWQLRLWLLLVLLPDGTSTDPASSARFVRLPASRSARRSCGAGLPSYTRGDRGLDVPPTMTNGTACHDGHRA